METDKTPDSRNVGLSAGLEGAGDEPLCFVVRKTDGRFLRGARFWQWTRNWRRAALLSPAFVKGFCLGKRFGIESMSDVDLYTVQTPSNTEINAPGEARSQRGTSDVE